jgi:signal transduction histidine kinase
MAVHLLQGMMVDHEGVHHIVNQQHRIQAAGTISAGLMHGLNNPASAIARTVGQLRSRVGQDRRHDLNAQMPPTVATIYERLRRETMVVRNKAVNASALEVADREERIEDWLTANSVDQPSTVAPIMVSAGLDVDWLRQTREELTEAGAADCLAPVVLAVADQLETVLLADELAKAAAEISAIVESARQYSQMDSSPLVVSDVNDLLESTLTVMSATLEANGIEVCRDYAPALPPLLCYAGELNQAWTNILDNAIYAIGAAHEDGGLITVRTECIDDRVIQVELCDNGIGIAADVRDRIFLPFFTTKPVGAGAGMGLDLAWRVVVGKHRGMLTASSIPGGSKLTACLPVQRPSA